MQSDRSHIHSQIEENLLVYSSIRTKQGFVSFIHAGGTSETCAITEPNKLNYPPGAVMQLFGTAFRVTMRLYGKDGKIYFDPFPHIIDGTAQSAEPKPLPAGKYCYVIVEVDAPAGKMLELRLKKAGTGAHWEMVSMEDRDKVKGAGELIIDLEHRLAFGTNNTGRYQNKTFEEQKKYFLYFFSAEYFSPENYYHFNGDKNDLMAAIAQRGLLGLVAENAPVLPTVPVGMMHTPPKPKSPNTSPTRGEVKSL